MNDLIEDHEAFGYVDKVEYRAIKEPGQQIDFIIRYYPGDEARNSVNRIRSRHPRKKRAVPEDLRRPKDNQPALLSPQTVNAAKPEIETLTTKLTGKPPDGFGISRTRAQSLIKTNRKRIRHTLALREMCSN